MACRAANSSVIELSISMIEQCITKKNLSLGKLIHGRLLKSALTLHTLLANRLLDMYSKCGTFDHAQALFDEMPHRNHQSWNTLLGALSRAGHLHAARQLFDEMPERNLVSFNTMISSLAHSGHQMEALSLFRRLRRDSMVDEKMDRFTVVAVAMACAGLEDLHAVRQLHAAVVVSGMEMNLIMSNVMIDAYGKCGYAEASSSLFDRMGPRDVVSWTSLIGAYARANQLEKACQVFERMPVRNSVSWTALISGYEQHGHEAVALELFQRMMEERVEPTPFTLVSLLSACARLGLIGRGTELHGYIVRRHPFNLFEHNALIDMYAKCGNISLATKVFAEMPERDFISWNSMVTGFAQNGHGELSLSVFRSMIDVGVKPNNVTFLAVLTACSHAGLVSEGGQMLRMMEEYNLVPKPEHYAAFIDALGRKRQLSEAMEFVESLHLGGGMDAIGVWGALLGACQVHGDLELAKKAAESLFVLDPQNGVRYITLSNIYSAAGRWDDARRLRAVMKEKGLKKDPGCSWIEVRSIKHVFVAEDKSHFAVEEIYGMLSLLVDQMKQSEESDSFRHFVE
ncbi:pentatricopeptide repeat-containing protein At2g22070-like [Dioscorea cayenensis subsp. rotundata]|uniref:Pentatricopeptide repeat-containing protein At2g22070-like n=1 Tax=Dioscorea cayennensis subsp. rotundata TaxID=55577 RepID=A0AB40BHS8_DIOCR|nr:pentatricopeptide repeat-containing protein At2g22070-like [Dioscorea cayenensis subsp. rotundata]